MKGLFWLTDLGVLPHDQMTLLFYGLWEIAYLGKEHVVEQTVHLMAGGKQKRGKKRKQESHNTFEGPMTQILLTQPHLSKVSTIYWEPSL